MKIAQGVSGTVKAKGSVHKIVPFLMQAARQGFQVRPPLFANDIPFNAEVSLAVWFLNSVVAIIWL